MVGATRQWVTICLKRLTEKHVVSTHRSDILIRQPDYLIQLRDGED